MPRTASNELKIEPLPDGRFRLFGRILGKHYRKRSRDYNALVEFKATKELEYAEQVGRLLAEPQNKTRMTLAQIADAESALLAVIGNRSLRFCVDYTNKYAPPEGDISCSHALKEWLVTLTARKRSARTEDKNARRVRDFIKAVKVANLAEITPLAIEQYVYRKGPADFTRLTDAQVLRAWLNFCVRRRWLAATPFEIDMKDLSATARPKEPGRILTPEQCHALLAACRAHANGLLVPYCILTTWLFMRDSEATRTTRAAMKLDAATPVVVIDTKKRRTVKYRTVTVPANVLQLLRSSVGGWDQLQTVPFSRNGWNTVRERAGLIARGKTTRGKRRPVLSSLWQSDITRHSGISYLYQQCGDIKEVCRQAGNKTDTSFRHYLTLPAEGAVDKFYASP